MRKKLSERTDLGRRVKLSELSNLDVAIVDRAQELGFEEKSNKEYTADFLAMVAGMTKAEIFGLIVETDLGKDDWPEIMKFQEAAKFVEENDPEDAAEGEGDFLFQDGEFIEEEEKITEGDTE